MWPVGTRRGEATAPSPAESDAVVDGGGHVGPTGRQTPTRVKAVDGLRGIAATLVVLYHLEEAISRTAADWLWGPVHAMVRHGYLGVDVFFVISGFVIALSVSRAEPSALYLGRFIVRRSIRLDPPYWAAIALELCLLYATLRVLPERAGAFPSGHQLLAHLFYVQELLGYGSIIPIFWTLCFEIQFYLMYVSLVVAGARLPARGRKTVVTGVMALLFAGSVWVRYWSPDSVPYGFAGLRWFQFFIGVLTWRAVVDRRNLPALVLAWTFLTGAILLSGASATQFLAPAVSALVMLCARYERVGAVLRARPLLWLGTISYSLYLFHSPVGWRFVSVAQLVIPAPWNTPTALAVYAAGIALCVAVAAVAWRIVEKPFLALAQRVSLPTSARPPLARPPADRP